MASLFGKIFGKKNSKPRKSGKPAKVSPTHAVLKTKTVPPFPVFVETAMFGMGSFWEAEKAFEQVEGVYSTQVGFTGGDAPHPTLEDVKSGQTPGHTLVVRVQYGPR